MNARIRIAAAVLAASVSQLYAATITVTSINDSGPGTLRFALANAADGDTINFSVTGAISQFSGELLVTNSIGIIGPGPDLLAINRVGGYSRVFHIGSNTVVSISSLTITRGLSEYDPFGGAGIYSDHATLTVSNCAVTHGYAIPFGGAIYNDHGKVTINGCTLEGNTAGSAGGVYNDGNGGTASLEIVNSTVSSNRTVSEEGKGGGIMNYGLNGSATMQIVESIVKDNIAYCGGGIYNFGNSGIAGVVIVNSTLSSNWAYGSYGGGIENIGSRGTATVEIVNSTLSGNEAGFLMYYAGYGGGIDNFVGNVDVANSTLSGNSAKAGGGINNRAATLQIVNSTLSDNSATNGSSVCNNRSYYGINTILDIGSTILNAGGPGSNIWNNGGLVTSLGYNLSSDDGGGFLTATGDQINTDPMLGPLQDNGGPTFTCALLPGSPAINAGDPHFTPPPDFDQRGPGFPRVVYGRIDVGAFEVQTLPDSDGDGVPDMFEQCPNTAPGAIVDDAGCSIAQLAPCAGPATGGTWKSHGQYVAAVVHAATDFLRARLISRRQWMQIVTQAARSRCGWNRRCDRDGDRDWSRAWDCDRDADWGRDRNEGTRENRP